MEADARQDARDRRPLRRRVPAVPCGSRYARGERQQSAETQTKKLCVQRATHAGSRPPAPHPHGGKGEQGLPSPHSSRAIRKREKKEKQERGKYWLIPKPSCGSGDLGWVLFTTAQGRGGRVCKVCAGIPHSICCSYAGLQERGDTGEAGPVPDVVALPPARALPLRGVRSRV